MTSYDTYAEKFAQVYPVDEDNVKWKLDQRDISTVQNMFTSSNTRLMYERIKAMKQSEMKKYVSTLNDGVHTYNSGKNFLYIIKNGYNYMLFLQHVVGNSNKFSLNTEHILKIDTSFEYKYRFFFKKSSHVLSHRVLVFHELVKLISKDIDKNEKILVLLDFIKKHGDEESVKQIVKDNIHNSNLDIDSFYLKCSELFDSLNFNSEIRTGIILDQVNLTNDKVAKEIKEINDERQANEKIPIVAKEEINDDRPKEEEDNNVYGFDDEQFGGSKHKTNKLRMHKTNKLRMHKTNKRQKHKTNKRRMHKTNKHHQRW